jgi:hypothetical protein
MQYGMATLPGISLPRLWSRGRGNGTILFTISSTSPGWNKTKVRKFPLRVEQSEFELRAALLFEVPQRARVNDSGPVVVDYRGWTRKQAVWSRHAVVEHLCPSSQSHA